MAKKNVILFNGGAALIGQEVGMLDLLREVKGVTLDPAETFVAGLSSGGLMVAVVNATLGKNPPITWETFKNEILFTIKNDDIFKKKLIPPWDTDPLRKTLTGVLNERAGYKQIKDLPFPSAILTASRGANRTCWINNAVSSIPSGDNTILQQIRENALQVDLVDSLMCTSAIPVLFPSPKLGYELNGSQKYVTDSSGEEARFLDGGTFGLFKRLEEFFKAYQETFENLYFITPNFFGSNTDFEEYSSELGDSLSEEHEEELLEVSEYFTRLNPFFLFFRRLRQFNKKFGLAKNMYTCEPQIKRFPLLNFETQREQYELTMEWGRQNPDQIAVDI